MNNQCVEKKISDIDYQELLQDISSLDNIWYMYYEEIDEEESSPNDYTGYIDNICFFKSKLWIERYKKINTDYAVTGWMLSVIPLIREDVFKNSNRNNMIEVNTVINICFVGSSEKELYETLDMF